MCYLMAGVPDPETFVGMAMACLDGGADVLEIGIPFSDPVADGPVIQEAGVRALELGVTPPMVMDMVRELRKRSDKPLVLMGYYNPVFRRGEQRFVDDCLKAGADGLIVPDLPLHEAAGLRECCERSGLDLVQLCTPLTPAERAGALARATGGFLYLVTRTGVTGGETELASGLEAMIERLRSFDGDVMLAAGFGISRPEQVRRVREMGADGAVVGSSLVAMTLAGRSPEDLRLEVERLSHAARGNGRG